MRIPSKRELPSLHVATFLSPVLNSDTVFAFLWSVGMYPMIGLGKWCSQKLLLLWGMSSDQICLFLRQRKDELEQRMSALQESRRELMVQLEGLMKLLKVRSSTWYYLGKHKVKWETRGRICNDRILQNLTVSTHKIRLFPSLFIFLPWLFNSGVSDAVVPVAALHHHCHLLLRGVRKRKETNMLN